MDEGLHTLCRRNPKYRALFGNSPQVPDAFRQLTEADLPCVHRGAKVRDANCQLVDCVGGALFSVFACSVHGECSLQTRGVKGLKACRKCRERAAE